MPRVARQIACGCVLAAASAWAQPADIPPADPQQAIAQRDAMIETELPHLRDDPQALQQGIERVAEYQQKLLDRSALADYWARPIWMADLAEKLLFSTLPSVYLAGDFTLVGYPNDMQRWATHALATEALRWLNRAQAEHFRLQSVLRPRDDFVTELVNTGHWDRLRQYAELNIPYTRAWATVYLLSYEPSSERRSELISQATNDLALVRQHLGDYELNSDVKARLNLLAAELAIRQRDVDTALRELTDAVAHVDAQPLTQLLAGLMRAEALQQAGRPGEAITRLDALRRSDIAADHPLHRVLIADRMFAIDYERAVASTDAARREELLNQAFEVYAALLSGNELGQWQPATARFVEQRYLSQLPANLPPRQWPAPVRLAAARRAFDDAERLHADNHTEEARSHYQRTVELLIQLARSDMAGAGPATRAETMFYLGVSQLRLNQPGAALLTLVDLAQQYPALPRGEQAVRIAVVNVGQPLFEQHPDNAELRATMDRMYHVLLDQYSGIDLAESAKYDYAAFLRRTGRYADALAAYDKIDDAHPSYVPAQFERLMCLGAMWQQSSPAERQTLAMVILPDVDRVMRLSDSQEFDESTAAALVLKAMVVNETMDDPDQAQQVMRQVRDRYGDVPGVSGQLAALSIRIHLKQGRYDQAVRELRQYAKDEPDKAGPLAVAVLSMLGDDPTLAVQLADEVVLPWARSQPGLTDEQRLAYEIMPARSMLAAGQYGEALDRFNAIVQQFGQTAEDNLDVIMGRAEAMLALQRFDEAAALYNRVILWAQQNNRREALYWQAILGAYRVQDARAGDATDSSIFRAVNRLQREDPQLGGEPYRSALLKLRDKHAPP